MCVVLNVPYDLLSEEVGADGSQPVDAGCVCALSCTTFLHRISHKRPEENRTADLTKYYKLNAQKGIDVLISTRQEAGF